MDDMPCCRAVPPPTPAAAADAADSLLEDAIRKQRSAHAAPRSHPMVTRSRHQGAPPLSAVPACEVRGRQSDTQPKASPAGPRTSTPARNANYEGSTSSSSSSSSSGSDAAPPRKRARRTARKTAGVPAAQSCGGQRAAARADASGSRAVQDVAATAQAAAAAAALAHASHQEGAGPSGAAATADAVRVPHVAWATPGTNKDTSSPLHMYMGNLRVFYPAFGGLYACGSSSKYAKCQHAGCSARIIFEAKADGAPTPEKQVYTVQHTAHCHDAVGPRLTMPSAKTRSKIWKAWNKWRASPTYTSALGHVLPLDLLRRINAVSLDRPSGGLLAGITYDRHPEPQPDAIDGGLLAGVAYEPAAKPVGLLTPDKPPPPPKSPCQDVQEVLDRKTALLRLLRAGYTLRSKHPIRVFDAQCTAVERMAKAELDRFARIAGLQVHQNWNTRRSNASRAASDIEQDMATWWRAYLHEAPHHMVELGGQSAVIFGAKDAVADDGTPTVRHVPLVAVGQAQDAAALRAHVLEACQVIDNAKGWAWIDDHFDGVFAMAGLASPPRVCHTAVGYTAGNEFAAGAEFDPGLVHRTLESLAQHVWRTTCRDVAPWMEPARRAFLSPDGQAACYNLTAINLVSRTNNCAVSLHVDTADGPYSIILWVNKCGEPVAGAPADAPPPTLQGGAFAMPAVNAQVTPLDMTIVVLAGGIITHGTMPVTATGGARRYGFSLFARMPALERIAVMASTAGGQDALLQQQWASTRAILAKRRGTERDLQRAKAKAWQRALREQPAAAPRISAYAAPRAPGDKWPKGLKASLHWLPDE